MKKLVCILFALVYAASLLGQDTIFFDIAGKRVSNLSQSEYYQVINKNNLYPNKVVVKEYYRKGKMKSWANYSDYSKGYKIGKEIKWDIEGNRILEIDYIPLGESGLTRTVWENGKISKMDTVIFSDFVQEKGDTANNTNAGLVYTNSDIYPQFPGGNDAIQKFIDDFGNFPYYAIKNHEEGKVIVSFVVEPDGTLTDVIITKSVCNEIDQEAIRIVKLMPKWVPGKENGEYVRVRIHLPINFATY